MANNKGYIRDSQGNMCYTIEDTGWQSLSPYLKNSWSDYGSGYRTSRYRVRNKEVILEGTLRNGKNSGNRQICVLPTELRPTQIMNCIIVSGMMESGKSIKVVVYPSGSIELQDYDGTSWIALNGIRFFTD